MKTIIICDFIGSYPIGYLVVNGDVSHLDGVYINDSCSNYEYQDELDGLLHEYKLDEKGEREFVREHPRLEKFPVELVQKEQCKVIVAGFLP